MDCGRNIYVYLEEGRPFYLYSMPVASVLVYLWKTKGFFTLLYLLQAGIMNFNGKSTCELIYPLNADMNFTEFLLTSYIIRTLEFRLIVGMNFPGEFRRNFFSLFYVG